MAERKIQRISPLTVTEAQRATLLAYGPGTPAEIGGQELITTSDQRRLFRGAEHLGPVDHGSVASAEAMAALYLLLSCTRGVWPGDTVWRSDEEREYRVISGANASAVWRAVASSRPDLDAAYAPTAHTHEIGDVVDLAAALSALGIGNPTADGQVLASTVAGVRSWVTLSPGGGTEVGAIVQATTTQSVPTGAGNAVAHAWTSEVADDGGCVDLATFPTRLTAPAAGTYLAGFASAIEGSSNSKYGWIRVSGGTLRHGYVATSSRSDGGATTITVSAVLVLSAGDYVEAMIAQNSGSSQLTYVEDGVVAPRAWLRKL